MRLEWKSVQDCCKGRSAICVAHGPSLNTYLDRLDEFMPKGIILIGTNDWYLFHPEVHPHFSVMANSVFTIEKQYQHFNDYKTVLVYASSVDLTPQEFIDQNLKCNYLPYDQRHFFGMTCKELMESHYQYLGGFDPKGQCCDRIGFTIQERLQEYTEYPLHYGTGDTVALHQIAFAILMGCNPIYVIGLDLDYNKGFASNIGSKSSKTVEVGAINDYTDRILKDLKIINFSAKNIDVDIINLNKNSWYNVLEIGNLI